MRPKGLLFADQVPAALGADAGSHGHSRVNAPTVQEGRSWVTAYGLDRAARVSYFRAARATFWKRLATHGCRLKETECKNLIRKC